MRDSFQVRALQARAARNAGLMPMWMCRRTNHARRWRAQHKMAMRGELRALLKRSAR